MSNRIRRHKEEFLVQSVLLDDLGKGFEGLIHLLVPRPLLVLSRLLFRKELRAAMGAGNRRTRVTKRATPERPLLMAFAFWPR